METGQLYMQMSARPVTDFASMVTTVAPSAAVAKRDSASFDGMLREVTPQRYSRTEQATRTEAKRVMPKKVEKQEEPIKPQPASKLAEASEQLDSKTDEINQNSLAVTDEKKVEKKMETAETLVPQNVEAPVIAARFAVVPQLPEDRKSKPADGLYMTVDEVEAQNATNTSVPPINADRKLQLDMAADLPVAVQLAGAVAEATDSKIEDVALPQVTLVPTVPLQRDVALKTQSEAKEIAVHQTVSSSEKGIKNIESAGLLQVEVPSAEIQKTAADAELTMVKAESPRLKADSGVRIANAVSIQAPTESNAALLQTDAQLLTQGEKVQSQPASAEFRFARSSTVDLAIEVGNQTFNQPKVSGEGAAVIETRSADTAKMPEVSQGSFKGSDAGSNGNSQEGFSQQNLDLPKPGIFQPANASLAATSNVSSTNSTGSTVQAVTQELNRMASSESVAGQVREQLSTRSIKQGSEQITIQLSPDHLGDIKVNFRLEDQKLRVEIVAENRTARESLLQHADSLKESLARQNINMEKFEVSGGNNGSTTGQGGYSQPEWREMAKNRQSQQWLASGGYRTQTHGAAVSAPVYFARAENSTLDLHF